MAKIVGDFHKLLFVLLQDVSGWYNPAFSSPLVHQVHVIRTN